MSPPELQRAKEKNPILELKIISANDVSHINATYKMDVYAVVSIIGAGTTQKKQSAKTPIDFYGGSNPTWNHTVKFSINEEATRLTLKIMLFSYWLEDENDLYLGQVSISVEELLASNPLHPLINGNNNKLKLVTYPIKITDGINGTLSFSYLFNPAAPVDDLSPSAPDYSLSFGQPVYLNPDPASSGQPLMCAPQFQTTMTKLKLMLVIKSAKDIKSVSSIRNEMDVYASVIIREGNTKTKDTANTPIVYCSYRNPRWDHDVEFSLDEKLVQEGRLTLVVKIIGVRSLLGDKGVGEVVVSIQELFALNPPSPPLTNGDGDNGMTLMTRDVTGSSGRKGTLSFTYRFLVEQASQPFIMYSIQGTSGYGLVHPGANAGPRNCQLPTYIPPQYHQSQLQPQPFHKPLLHTQSQPHKSHGYQQYPPTQPQPQPHKPQSQIQPLHHPLLHTQSQSHQQYSPPQGQVQPQPLPHWLPPAQQPLQSEPQTDGAKPVRKPQGETIAALSLGAAIAGRVIGGALMGEIMSDEVNMYEVEA